MTGPLTFRFLGVEATLSPRQWNDPGRALLWTYNLHYFDDLHAVDAADRDDWHRALVTRWIAENPPASGSGWTPYPTSLRIVNWIKWILSARRHDAPLPAGLVDSLAVQTRWLRRRLETHLLGNHLWANAKALIFAGVFFEGAEADRWLRHGCALLDEQLQEQILEDGGHFERSPMYQATLLEDVLDLLNLAQTFSGVVPGLSVERLDATASRMLRWLQVMTHPDGQIAFFNDAAFDIAASHAALADYARQLGVKAPRPPEAPLACLAESGYIRLENARAVVICDVGPLGPDYLLAHGHADTLSFELSIDGHRVLVNSGTSTYAQGAERTRQRGTAAHNTVVVDGHDSSDVWGSFRVGRRARPLHVESGIESDGTWARASHDGYRWLPGRAVHRRSWRLEPECLRVDDEVEGAHGEAVAMWHLSPAVKQLGPPAERALTLEAPAGARVELRSSGDLAVTPSTWHPRFGESVAALKVSSSFSAGSLATALSWQ
jgi:uncharacterized heparinase superfamily protein